MCVCVEMQNNPDTKRGLQTLTEKTDTLKRFQAHKLTLLLLALFIEAKQAQKWA